MAIKKRPQVDPEKEAKIEAFGAAAESPAPTPAATTARTAPARTPRPATRKPAQRTGDIAKTFLVRWPNDELPLLLAEVSALEDRSQHAVVLRALRRGLEAMKADAGE